MKRLIPIPLAFWLLSCIDPFQLVIQENNQLVVEALITNVPGPYRIKLYSRSQTEPVRGASIRIEDDLGQSVSFLESIPGTYQSDSSVNFQGQIGRSYVLTITTKDGVLYCSQPEEMVAVPEIAEVKVQPATRKFISNLGNEITINGFKVEIVANSNPNQGTFLRWDYRGIYALRTPDPCNGCSTTCWFIDEPPNEYLRIQGTPVINANLTPVDLDFFLGTFEFDTAYIMRIKQLSLNPNAFEFWREVNNQRVSTGSVFDATPSTINGNISNCGDAQEIVLGYFGASAVTNREFSILKNELLNFEVSFVPPLEECFREEIGPNYCTDCLLLPNSNKEIPEVTW